jgi:hypothetical protein
MYKNGSLYVVAVYAYHDVYPTVYLLSNVVITGGNGSESSPFTISAS